MFAHTSSVACWFGACAAVSEWPSCPYVLVSSYGEEASAL